MKFILHIFIWFGLWLKINLWLSNKDIFGSYCDKVKLYIAIMDSILVYIIDLDASDMWGKL